LNVEEPSIFFEFQFSSFFLLIAETELRNMVLDVDQNDNGMIEFNEFLQMMSKKMREGDSEDELKEAFK
jgi:Ca2+-binding EF-hand superfamily protein